MAESTPGPQCHILRLPDETLCNIAEHMLPPIENNPATKVAEFDWQQRSYAEGAAFARSCKRLNRVVTAYLYSTIVIGETHARPWIPAQAMHKLQRTMEKDPEIRQMCKTVWRVGYMTAWNAHVGIRLPAMAETEWNEMASRLIPKIPVPQPWNPMVATTWFSNATRLCFSFLGGHMGTPSAADIRREMSFLAATAQHMPHLHTLKISAGADFESGAVLACAFAVIDAAPGVHTLLLDQPYETGVPDREDPFVRQWVKLKSRKGKAQFKHLHLRQNLYTWALARLYVEWSSSLETLALDLEGDAGAYITNYYDTGKFWASVSVHEKDIHENYRCTAQQFFGEVLRTHKRTLKCLSLDMSLKDLSVPDRYCKSTREEARYLDTVSRSGPNAMLKNMDLSGFQRLRDIKIKHSEVFTDRVMTMTHEFGSPREFEEWRDGIPGIPHPEVLR